MKQDYKEVEQQIDRFFEGQTSNEEERELYAFFTNENVPEHLLPYRPVIAYFETGIKEEKSIYQITKRKHTRSSRKNKVSIWVSVAASLVILISFGMNHFMRENEIKPYEGSYIIRNGVKITDPKIVIPEIEETIYLVQQQAEEFERLLQNLHEINRKDPYKHAVNEIKLQHLKWVDQLEDETVRNEVLKIINFEL